MRAGEREGSCSGDAAAMEDWSSERPDSVVALRKMDVQAMREVIGACIQFLGHYVPLLGLSRLGR